VLSIDSGHVIEFLMDANMTIDPSRPFAALPPEGSHHDLLVIGGASLDVLHLSDGQIAHAAGGAGLYTALAAARAGARVVMHAPRPEPMPIELAAASRHIAWSGPVVPPDELPRFEIAHHGGGRATLVNAVWGGEMLITAEALPLDQITAPIVHIAALRSAERQLSFARRLKSPDIRLSAGTYSHICRDEPAVVRAILELADYFFMNENEATLLFGRPDRVSARPGQLVFVTLGERGALVVQGDHVTRVAGLPAVELDPTGAGDTFCGTVLAALAGGDHPIMAARRGTALAAHMIGGIGPAQLLVDAPAPPYPADGRVRVDETQVGRVAALIKHLPEVQPFDFTGELYPPPDDPGALDWFFAATVQQFGFWEARDQHYAAPLIARLDGRALKGSDYLFAAYRRAWRREPAIVQPVAQAALTAEQLAALWQADDGASPMPALALHAQQANAYGRDLQALGLTPAAIVEQANRAARPRAALLSRLDHVGGYKEDPLRKKSMLLALILEQRPEHWLRPAPEEDQPPVIDYHLMRSCLRTGLIEVIDDDLQRRLTARQVLPAADEWAVRLAAFEAVGRVQRQSGRGMGAVDWFFFNARRRCPEMTVPDCAACAVDAVCAHRVALFQPVFRTTFY